MVLVAKTWLKVSYNFIYIDKPLKHVFFFLLIFIHLSNY